MPKCRKPPTSGYEHPFIENEFKKLIKSNNCYAYAVHDKQTFRIHKSIPGDRSGLSKLPHTYTHCNGLAKRVLSDNPGKIYKAKACEKCKKNYYKIMMFVAPTNKFMDPYGDFHFYKQHSEVRYIVKPGDTRTSIAKFFKVPVKSIGKITVGRYVRFPANIWTHKQGWATKALMRDASGKSIQNPLTANRKYGHNYSKYCTSFCVKNRGINVGKTKPDVPKKRF